MENTNDPLLAHYAPREEKPSEELKRARIACSDILNEVRERSRYTRVRTLTHAQCAEISKRANSLLSILPSYPDAAQTPY